MGFLRAAARWSPAEAAAAPVGAAALAELEDAHDRLIALHLEKTLRSARVVKEMRSES
jgi:hypothetical protein